MIDKNIKAIAFDIDGTLYSSFRLYRGLGFYVLKNLKFYLHYNHVRKILHKTGPLPDFYEYQARLLAEELHCTSPEAKEKIQRIVYDGLKPRFEKIKPFKNVLQTFKDLRESGYKLALLSDFPPEQKGNVWGVADYCDQVLGTEKIGALKPSKYPYGILAIKLGLKPEEILYVGNSIKYDVIGAKNAGMKTALIISPLKKLLNSKAKLADITFSNYRQFLNIVLK